MGNFRVCRSSRSGLPGFKFGIRDWGGSIGAYQCLPFGSRLVIVSKLGFLGTVSAFEPILQQLRTLKLGVWGWPFKKLAHAGRTAQCLLHP